MSEENKDLGDKAEEAFDKAKETAKEAAEDVKEAFDANNPESGKTVAILAHITLIGWIIAIIMNSSNKTELGSFYVRQTLGIFLIGILSAIPILGILVGLFCFVLWIVSLINAISGSQKPVFLVGEMFQSWFKGL